LKGKMSPANPRPFGSTSSLGRTGGQGAGMKKMGPKQLGDESRKVLREEEFGFKTRQTAKKET